MRRLVWMVWMEGVGDIRCGVDVGRAGKVT